MGTTLSSIRGIPGELTKLTADTAFWPRAAILVGVGATITMNVTAGLGYGPGAAVVAAFIPVVFVIALESFIVVMRRCTWPWWIGAGLVLVPAAGIAGWVSWLHGHQVCLWTHNPDPQAQLIPFLPDLLIVCGTVALVALKTKTSPAPRANQSRSGQPQPSQPRASQKTAPKTTSGVRFKALEQLNPAQIEREQEVGRELATRPKIPGDRAVAAEFFDDNRGAARRAIQYAKAQPALNGKEH